jgi:hypothetical protein
VPLVAAVEDEQRTRDGREAKGLVVQAAALPGTPQRQQAERAEPQPLSDGSSDSGGGTGHRVRRQIGNSGHQVSREAVMIVGTFP